MKITRHAPSIEESRRAMDAAGTPRGQAKIGKVMHELKAGTLRSSSGDKVTSRAQGIAIALSEARRMKHSGKR